MSFAALHRVLKLVAEAPNGLRASDINRLVIEKEVILTRRDSPPSPTTLYRYRNTLLALNAIKRDKHIFRINTCESIVCDLLRQPIQPDESITDEVREKFSALVFGNKSCKSLFFRIFMPSLDDRSFSVNDFKNKGTPVTWKFRRSGNDVEVSFRNVETKETRRYTTHSSVKAVLYGLRYWARDELKLIDEYGLQREQTTIMYPLSKGENLSSLYKDSALEIANFILSLRNKDEWTFFSVSDLILQCCIDHRQPISALHSAIDLLHRQSPDRVVLIPTTPSLVTLTAKSSQQERLHLRRYYRSINGLLISHIRIHQSLTSCSGKE